MAEALYLSLWFPTFTEAEMMPRVSSVLRQFPFSAAIPGIRSVVVYPFSFANAPVYAHAFDFPCAPERAVSLAGEFLHDDYAYEFEAAWDLWLPDDEMNEWRLRPGKARVIAHGPEFEDQTFQQNGHVQIDFGSEAPFLQEEEELTSDTAARIAANIQKLVALTAAIEKNCGITGRVLWSESEENLAQKLVARLQRTQ